MSGQGGGDSWVRYDGRQVPTEARERAEHAAELGARARRGDARAVDSLLGMLWDADETVVDWAVVELGLPLARSRLVTLAADARAPERVRRAAMEAIDVWEGPATRRLLRLLTHSSEPEALRELVAEHVHLGRDDALEAIATVAADDSCSSALRATAATRLGGVYTQGSVDLLVGVAREAAAAQDEALCDAAVGALDDLGGAAEYILGTRRLPAVRAPRRFRSPLPVFVAPPGLVQEPDAFRKSGLGMSASALIERAPNVESASMHYEAQMAGGRWAAVVGPLSYEGVRTTAWGKRTRWLPLVSATLRVERDPPTATAGPVALRVQVRCHWVAARQVPLSRLANPFEPGPGDPLPGDERGSA